jgi:gliding motility-associated-like protein
VDENCNTSNGSATVNITSGQPPITYTWSNGGANSPTINNLTAGNYSVTVSSGNGCTSSSNFTIANIFGPQLIVSNLVDDHCGKGVGQATVTVTNSTGSFTYTWLLTPPQVGQTVTGLSEGVYLVAVTDGTCSDTISIPIANMPNPTANFEPSPSITTASNAAIRFINQSVGGYTYNWFFGDGDTSTLVSPVHNYLSSQTYTVLLQVTDEYGCIDTISKTIIIYEDLEVFIPNAFTPNGDGKNDIFRPYGKGYKLDGYEMLIFDRWGKMIFQTNTFDKGWDGRVDGTLANINAVFMYKMVIRDLNNQEHRYRGTFTILGSKNALGN